MRRGPYVPSDDKMGRFIRPLLVVVLLSASQAIALIAQLDFHSLDDTMRLVLAQGWAREPWFYTSDVYWLPLPFWSRGIAAAASHFIGGTYNPTIEWIAVRLVNSAYIWGIWFLLDRFIRVNGGSTGARWILAFAICTSWVTYRLNTSALCEPETLFWITLSISVLSPQIDHIESRENPNVRPLRYLGIALALACLSRYEAWTTSGLIILAWCTWAAPETARIRRQGWVWVAGLPFIVIAGWMALSAWEMDNPTNFLFHGASYVEREVPENKTFMWLDTTWRIQGVLGPLMLISATIEFFKRRHEPIFKLLLLIVLFEIGWGAYKTISLPNQPRFIWPLYIWLSVIGAMGAMRIIGKLGRVTRIFIILLVAAMALNELYIRIDRMQTSLSPELRAFAKSAAELARETDHSRGGSILFLDYELPEDERLLHTLRAFMPHDQLILREWMEKQERLGKPAIPIYPIVGVIAQKKPETDPDKGTVITPVIQYWEWVLWRYEDKSEPI